MSHVAQGVVPHRASRIPPPASRAVLEWTLRTLVLVILAGYLVYTIVEHRHGPMEVAASETLRTSLERWSTVSAPARVHVTLAHPPAGLERDWLAALPAAGTAVEWSGPSLRPTAIAVEPVPDPARSADVSIAAPAAETAVLRDTLGVLDSARATEAGVRFHVPRPRRVLDATVGPVHARAAVHDSLELGRLLVLGQAGWETKFTIAALEERGWHVDAHVVVSPKSDVRQGKITSIDTARYAAVLAIDTTAARYASRIARFVRSGGGLVLWTAATAAPSLAALAPGRAGERILDEGKPPSDSAPRSALGLVPIVHLTSDAIVLERRANDASLAARRIGSGRVLETGYVDVWRWRMAGGDDAPAAHRAWIAGLVARVAYARRHALAAPPTDVAPLATLVDRLGPAAPSGARWAEHHFRMPVHWMFAALCLALFVEWASRRLRGIK